MYVIFVSFMTLSMSITCITRLCLPSRTVGVMETLIDSPHDSRTPAIAAQIRLLQDADYGCAECIGRDVSVCISTLMIVRRTNYVCLFVSVIRVEPI